ncbi:RNA polymerase sigma factor [Rhodococcus erythropolis]|uniref:RNA polymerase sigma factor n=1 Tax=Rhodococcus erythropolis TaxID=1833 RepID=UPI00211E5598|nr:sigma-70 family RNA polymerase sigma factor [Rhodococcus erythropolis]
MKERAPDLPALYLLHRESMYRVAASLLRRAGLVDDAADVVHAAVLSILPSPPTGVQNWEAFLVTAVKRKALDHLKSAAVIHSGPEISEDHDCADAIDVAEDVADAVDRGRLTGLVTEALQGLDERLRVVAWEYIALNRPRVEVAAQLGVTPARVSQMKLEALAALRDTMAREEVRR